MKLGSDFYSRPDVVQVARELLGKTLVTNIGGELTAGIIVETEAYEGETDRASHAFGRRYTDRTRVMYAAGGIAYVYLCYGIHHLFNVVTNVQDTPHAVLIRGIEPIEGLEIMLRRRGRDKVEHSLTAGPGALSEALGIKTIHTGTDLSGSTIYILDEGLELADKDIIASPRVGVGYALDHALWPYRFRIKGNRWVSKAR